MWGNACSKLKVRPAELSLVVDFQVASTLSNDLKIEIDPNVDIVLVSYC